MLKNYFKQTSKYEAFYILTGTNFIMPTSFVDDGEPMKYKANSVQLINIF